MNSIKSVSTKKSGDNIPDDQVVFYEKLFVENPNWSSSHPNDDEAARWECIASVLSGITRQSLNSPEYKSRIIDVGCGRGWLANLLTEYGSVEGVEPVAPVINHARQLFPNIKFYHGDAQTILTSPSFSAYDIAVCSEVLEHINDSEKKIFVDNLIRLLKPGGHLIITTPRREAQDDWLHYCGAPGQPVEDWLDEKQVEVLFTETGVKKTNLKRVLFEGKTKSFITNDNTKLPIDPKVISIYQVWSFQKPNSQSLATEKLLEVARIAVNEGKINDALESLLEALKIKSDCQDTLLILAEIDNQSEGLKNYHKCLQQASNERPDDPDLAFKWAIIANKAEDSEALEQALDRVLRLQPTHRGAHRLIADTFMLVENYGKAAPIYHSLATEDPSDIQALISLSKCLIYGAEWESAIAVIKATLAADPDNLIATAQLGEVQNKLAKIKSKLHLNLGTIDLSSSEAKFDYLNTPATRQRPKYNYVQKNISEPARVSIITPFYNISEIFHETAQSIMRQSMQDFEWIIINDGTTDPRSLEVLNKYRFENNRIRVVDHEVNLGLSAARNTGFREARTNYVVQLDGDDLLEPTAVEKWFWYLESHRDVAFVNSYSIGFGEKCYRWTRGFDRRTDFLEENQVPAFAMIRRTVHEAVGGYDEKIRGGLEDWDYWLRCANSNLWGKTIGEFHSWYRRRGEHSDRWSNLQVDHIAAMREKFRIKYSRLWGGGFPLSEKCVHTPYTPIATSEASTGVLAKINRRLILVIPWMTVGGADKFNLDLIGQLCEKGWEITVVATLAGDQAWMGLFAQLTPDIFVLPNFLEPIDYPRFLQHLVHSRQVDVIMVSHSEWGYKLLPFLRSHCPNVTLVDYCHIEEESWNNGGYPRYSIQYQETLDLTMVSSYHLKGWMQFRGAQNCKVVVCTTNVDPTRWKPSIEDRDSAKNDLGLPTDRPVILFAARMVPQKQPVVLAETLLRLNNQGILYTALVVGGGPEEKWLKDFVANHNLGGQVKLLGTQSNETVAKLLRAADVFFLPSINEGIALSLYEAMGAGVAVVGADVGGQSELVDTDCGFLIKPINPEEDTVRYVNILRRLLISTDTIKKMGAAGRARIENRFSLKMMGEQVDQILEQACEVHHKSVTVSKGIGLICASEAIELDQSKATDPLEVVCVAGNILAQAGEFGTALKNYRFARGLTQLPIQNGLAVQIDSVISQLVEKQEKNQNIHQQLKQSASNLNKEAEDVLSPLVSIVIICFKQAHLLQEAVNSVLWQHYKKWELIIVNDGSPDNVREIAQDLIDKNRDRSIYLVNKLNGGQADARNSGFAHASGSLYLPLDADDCLHPNYLKLTVAALQNLPGVGVAFTDIQHFGSRRDTWSTGPFIKEVMSRDNRLPYCSLYRRSLFDSVGGYSNDMRGEYEDWDFWLTAIEKGWTAIKVAEPLFLYRKHDGGMLQIANSKREALYQKIVNRHPTLYEKTFTSNSLYD